MNPNIKKHRKIKDTLKAVKKIDDDQMENITELVNRIYIQRHKLRMIWFLINRKIQQASNLLADGGSGGDHEPEEDEDEEETK